MEKLKFPTEGMLAPRDFALRYRHNIKPKYHIFEDMYQEAIMDVIRGPSCEWYWDSWVDILRSCYVELNGKKYCIEDDGKRIYLRRIDDEHQRVPGCE